MVTPRSVGHAILVAMAAIALPFSNAAAQCPVTNSTSGASPWSDAQMSRWATEHWYAAGNLPQGDQCRPILETAAEGIENAWSTCGIWWVDPFVLGGEAGAMPNTLGQDTALILINSRLQPPAGGAEGQMPDPHPSAQPGDSVGTREVVTHEALHASFHPTYFGRGLSNLTWEAAARTDAALCAHLVDFTAIFDVWGTGAAASSPERAGFQGVALAAIIVGIVGGWGIARRRRIAAGG